MALRTAVAYSPWRSPHCRHSPRYNASVQPDRHLLETPRYSTGRWSNVVLKLAHCLRRCANIKTTLGKHHSNLWDILQHSQQITLHPWKLRSKLCESMNSNPAPTDNGSTTLSWRFCTNHKYYTLQAFKGCGSLKYSDMWRTSDWTWTWIR